MSQLKKSESTQDQSFPITKTQLCVIVIVTLSVGISLPFIFSWLKQIYFPVKNDNLIEEKSKDSYDYFDKCPPLNASGIEIKIISWNADTKKCIYEYEVNIDS